MNPPIAVRGLPWSIVVSLFLTAPVCLPAAGTTPALKPVAAEPLGESAREISNLIHQLGDEKYWVRQQAHEQLARFGAEAFDALVTAQENDDLEIAERARELVQRVRIDWVRETDSPEIKEKLKDYETLSDADRDSRMKDLAATGSEGAIVALCRLIRFERSPLLSKRAALNLLRRPQPSPPGWEKKSNAILKILVGSNRPAAQWLLAWVRHHEQPENGLTDWAKFVDDELAVSDSDVAMEMKVQTELLRFQAEMLLDLNHHDRALAVMRKMVDRQTDDAAGLIEFVGWLSTHDAWPVVDDVAKRFDHSFMSNPRLLYTLAHARKIQGNDALAEKFAQRAFDLQTPTHDASDAIGDRLNIARELQIEGLMAWSEREYRFVLAKADRESNEMLAARFDLGEMLHDAQRDGEAAEIYQTLVDQLKNNGLLQQRLSQFDPPHPPKSVRSRTHFFHACAAAAKNDRAAQIEHLDKAIGFDSTDADVLIALYRLPEQSADRRDATRGLIRDAADRFRDDLGDQPSGTPLQAVLCNEYAWLVANTEGDLDKSLECALRAVQFEPVGSYLDTLSHCYAAKKDFASAVKYQEQAAALEPYSQQIHRALVQYRAALAAEKPKK